MINVKTGIRSEEVRQEARHVLFVEGTDQDAVDPKVLDALFRGKLRIEPLGSSFSVSGVAEALHRYHPTYYFLIDRDHHEHDFVESCWANFPDPNKHNLLVWRRREIENYFLEPIYLVRSKYCCVNAEGLCEKVLHFSNQRLFLDAANHAVISIREELKTNWIKKFTNPGNFRNKDSALRKLLNANQFGEHLANIKEKVSPEEVERRFLEFLGKMTGGLEKLKFGSGDWLHLIQGKKVLGQVVNSECFKVVPTDGNPLTGREKLNEVVKELLKNDTVDQPQDFKALKALIDERIKGSS